MSKAEQEAMFRRAGMIRDIFIPMVRGSRKPQGVGFVRLGTLTKTEKAFELAEGKSWGGRRIKANLVRYNAGGSISGESVIVYPGSSHLQSGEL